MISFYFASTIRCYVSLTSKQIQSKLNHYVKVTGCLCGCVAKELANRWADMVLLYCKVSHRSRKVYNYFVPTHPKEKSVLEKIAPNPLWLPVCLSIYLSIYLCTCTLQQFSQGPRSQILASELYLHSIYLSGYLYIYLCGYLYLTSILPGSQSTDSGISTFRL